MIGRCLIDGRETPVGIGKGQIKICPEIRRLRKIIKGLGVRRGRWNGVPWRQCRKGMVLGETRPR